MLTAYLGFGAAGVEPGVYSEVPANHLGCTGGGPQINPIPLQLGQGLHGDLDVEVRPGAADVDGHNCRDSKQRTCKDPSGRDFSQAAVAAGALVQSHSHFQSSLSPSHTKQATDNARSSRDINLMSSPCVSQ